MADTSTKQTYALSTDEIKHVAEQVGKQVIMGPAYYDPELIDRMGIQVISGVQFKKVDTLLVRQGGTTRRKVVGKPVSNKIGILKERTLEAKLSWNRFTDNIDRYVETVFGTDGKPGGDYPFSTTAAEAIMRTYAEDLTANLFFGDGDNDVYAEKERKGETLTPEEKEKAKLSLYNGFHTNINLDIADFFLLNHAHECAVVDFRHPRLDEQGRHNHIEQHNDEQRNAVVEYQRFLWGFHFFHFPHLPFLGLMLIENIY